MAISYLRNVQNVTFFTYFSEFDRAWNGYAYFEVVLMTLILIPGIVGNFLVILIVFKNQRMRTITNYLIVNLAFSDCVFVLMIPLVAATRITEDWVLGQFACKMTVYLICVSGTVSLWTMMVISIDRFFNIVKLGSIRISPQLNFAIVFVIWLGALAINIPIAFYFQAFEVFYEIGEESAIICSLDWPNHLDISLSVLWTSILFIFGYISPLAVIATNYWRVFRKLSKTKQRLAKNYSTPSSPTLGKEHRLWHFSKHHIRVVKILIFIVVLLVVTWVPIFIVMFMINFDVESQEVESWHFLLATCLVWLTSAINPLIYGLINDTFKQNFRNLLKGTSGEKFEKRARAFSMPTRMVSITAAAAEGATSARVETPAVETLPGDPNNAVTERVDEVKPRGKNDTIETRKTEENKKENGAIDMDETKM